MANMDHPSGFSDFTSPYDNQYSLEADQAPMSAGQSNNALMMNGAAGECDPVRPGAFEQALDAEQASIPPLADECHTPSADDFSDEANLQYEGDYQHHLSADQVPTFANDNAFAMLTADHFPVPNAPAPQDAQLMPDANMTQEDPNLIMMLQQAQQITSGGHDGTNSEVSPRCHQGSQISVTHTPPSWYFSSHPLHKSPPGKCHPYGAVSIFQLRSCRLTMR